MIARIITRTLTKAPRILAAATPTLTHTNTYNLSRKVEKTPSSVANIIETEIKAEQDNMTDLAEKEDLFKQQGWAILKENTLVELSKNTGKYDIRLLSNIKSPTQFDQDEAKEQQGEEESPYNGDMNEVTICVTKTGSDKTLVINTIVTEGFEITNMNFAVDYAAAKKNRLDIFASNNYTGPEM
jgi:hypothetical protein